MKEAKKWIIKQWGGNMVNAIKWCWDNQLSTLEKN